MEKVVVDTDVVIDFLRTNAGLLLHIMKLQKDGLLELFFSSITIMELYAGEMTKSELEMIIDLIRNFKVVPFDQQLAQFTGEKKRGERLQIRTSDFIIGATSIYLEARLVTRNNKHYKGIRGLKYFDLTTFPQSN